MASSRHHHATSTSGTDAALLVFASVSLFLSRLHRSLSSTTLLTQQAAPTAAGNAARSPARGRREVNVGQPTPKESTMRQLSIAVSVMALVLVASCGVAFATHSPSAAREVVGLDTTGAQYALFLPYNWNGDLVVYAHGFFDPATRLRCPMPRRWTSRRGSWSSVNACSRRDTRSPIRAFPKMGGRWTTALSERASCGRSSPTTSTSLTGPSSSAGHWARSAHCCSSRSTRSRPKPPSPSSD